MTKEETTKRTLNERPELKAFMRELEDAPEELLNIVYLAIKEIHETGTLKNSLRLAAQYAGITEEELKSRLLANNCRI